MGILLVPMVKNKIKGTSKNYFFFDASFDTNIYYGFLKT